MFELITYYRNLEGTLGRDWLESELLAYQADQGDEAARRLLEAIGLSRSSPSPQASLHPIVEAWDSVETARVRNQFPGDNASTRQFLQLARLGHGLNVLGGHGDCFAETTRRLKIPKEVPGVEFELLMASLLSPNSTLEPLARDPGQPTPDFCLLQGKDSLFVECKRRNSELVLSLAHQAYDELAGIVSNEFGQWLTGLDAYFYLNEPPSVRRLNRVVEPLRSFLMSQPGPGEYELDEIRATIRPIEQAIQYDPVTRAFHMDGNRPGKGSITFTAQSSDRGVTGRLDLSEMHGIGFGSSIDDATLDLELGKLALLIKDVDKQIPSGGTGVLAYGLLSSQVGQVEPRLNEVAALLADTSDKVTAVMFVVPKYSVDEDCLSMTHDLDTIIFGNPRAKVPMGELQMLHQLGFHVRQSQGS